MPNDEIIKIEGLRKIFSSKQNSVTALEDVNFSINKGEIFGVIGLSGAGKSTLVRCMNFLEKPTAGKVIFEGKDLSKLTTRELNQARQSMGMIFQGFNLLEQRTAFKNICYPMELAGIEKAKAKKRAEYLLELVGLANKAQAYPSQLSGGQKQRIAIARALATEPKVLLCDEATSALDPNTTQSILALLKDINARMGVTIVIITHEMSVIEQICNRVAVMEHSKVVELGNVKDIFLKPQSTIAKQLIMPKGNGTLIKRVMGNKCLRIVFDGTSSFEPVISNIALECHAAVNIMFASTENIDGKAFGHMIVQLPEDEPTVARIYAYLDSKNICYEEEELDV